jgi:hypothetical protein
MESEEVKSEFIEDIDNINLDNILWNSLINNKIILFALIPLFIGYYLQFNVFTNSVTKITSDVPAFVKDATFQKIALIIIPLLIAMVLFYISDNITTKGLHRIELNSIHELVTKIVESAKTTKVHKPVGEIITHIRRFLEVRNVYKIFIMYIIPTIAIGIGISSSFFKSFIK